MTLTIDQGHQKYDDIRSEEDIITQSLKDLKKNKKVCNRADCQRSEKRSETQEIKRIEFNYTKQDKTCKFLRKSSFSTYVQQKNKRLI